MKNKIILTICLAIMTTNTALASQIKLFHKEKPTDAYSQIKEITNPSLKTKLKERWNANQYTNKIYRFTK